MKLLFITLSFLMSSHISFGGDRNKVTRELKCPKGFGSPKPNGENAYYCEKRIEGDGATTDYSRAKCRFGESLFKDAQSWKCRKRRRVRGNPTCRKKGHTPNFAASNPINKTCKKIGFDSSRSKFKSPILRKK